MASGPTEQRWKDNGVFAFERLGGSHLLAGLNKDSGTTRTITVQTAFGANQELQNLTDDQAPRIKTNANSIVKITIPKNNGGLGYVCYGRPAKIEPFTRTAIQTSQEYEGSSDLDIKPAIAGEKVQVCRVFPDAHSTMRISLRADTANWTPKTNVTVTAGDSNGTTIGTKTFDRDNQGSSFSVQTQEKNFHSVSVEAADTPAQNSSPKYTLIVAYTAPQDL